VPYKKFYFYLIDRHPFYAFKMSKRPAELNIEADESADKKAKIQCTEKSHSLQEEEKEKHAVETVAEKVKEKEEEQEESSCTSSEDSEEEKKPYLFVWVLTMTTFTDDYKPRGENWSENSQPRLFSSKEKAESELLKELKKYMYEEANASSDPPVFNNPERWHKVEDSWELLPQYRESLEIVEEEISPFIEGEFVCVKFSWDLTEVEVDA